MCVGSILPKPKIVAQPAPVMPEPVVMAERQVQKLPDGGNTDNRADYLSKRRRGLAAMILTGPSGILGTPRTGSLGGGQSG